MTEFQPIPTTHGFQDLTGQEFDRLTVLGYAGKHRGRSSWYCECSCGNITGKVTSLDLKQRNTRSCGCIHDEFISDLGKTKLKHGMSHSLEFNSWASMKQRCTNKAATGYENYGGRGIAVCDRWMKSFENFLEDMGPRPSKKHSIERVDGNGNYCKENCKWATSTEQNRNSRNCHYIEFNGVKKTLVEWSTPLGLTPEAIPKRIAAGWSAQKALTTPKAISQKPSPK